MQLMTNILLCVLVGLFASSVIAFWLVFRRIRAVVIDFLTPESENKPSPFGLAIDGVASSIARAIMAQAKAYLMGLQSGQVRGEKAIQGDLALDDAQNSPIGALLNYPNVRRTLKRNPGLMDIAAQFLLPRLLGQTGQGQNSGNHAESSPPRFKL